MMMPWIWSRVQILPLTTSSQRVARWSLGDRGSSEKAKLFSDHVLELLYFGTSISLKTALTSIPDLIGAWRKAAAREGRRKGSTPRMVNGIEVVRYCRWRRRRRQTKSPRMSRWVDVTAREAGETRDMSRSSRNSRGS